MSHTDRTLNVAVVGDNCVDHLLAPFNLRFVGGNAVNVGVQLARLGAQTTYFGAVGRDHDGRQIADALAKNGVDLTYLMYRDMPTARTEISFDNRGDRVIDVEDFGACDGYRPNDAAIAALIRMDHVHIGWLNDGGALRRRLVAAEVRVSQDISVNAAREDRQVEGLDFAFASILGSHEVARKCAANLRAQGAKGVVVTRNADGSSAFLPSGEFCQSALPTTPVDTTGAGDSFIAGFVFATAQGFSPATAMQTGAELAEKTCRHAGGFPQDPNTL